MLECDNCKEDYSNDSGFSIFIDKESAIEDASEDGWDTHHDSEKHYCDECHHYNDNDEFILNIERTKIS